MEECYSRKSRALAPVPREAEAASSSRIDLDRHDTHAVLTAGTEYGILVRERPGGAGEVGLTSASTPSHTAFDVSDFYNSGRYHWGRLTSPACETATRFDTLIPSWRATTPAVKTRVSGGASTAVTSSPGPGSAPALAESLTSLTRMARRRSAP